jgi:hypothetical protein
LTVRHSDDDSVNTGLEINRAIVVRRFTVISSINSDRQTSWIGKNLDRAVLGFLWLGVNRRGGRDGAETDSNQRGENKVAKLRIPGGLRHWSMPPPSSRESGPSAVSAHIVFVIQHRAL